MEGFAYEIKRQDTNETILQGILRNSEDTIYPAQEEPYLVEEFPSLPYECEFHHFKVEGLIASGFYFDTSIEELEKWKV